MLHGCYNKEFHVSQTKFIGLSFIERPMLISRLNLRLVQIGRKAPLSNRPKKPPPPFCLLVRYSACVVSHDITLPKHVSHIIEHLIKDLAEKPPPPAAEQWKCLDWICPFRAISSNFGSSGRKEPPPKAAKQGNILDWIYSFHAISSNFGSAGRKGPHPCSAFLSETQLTSCM